MKTRFNDWKIDGYTAKSPCGKYELWIANGFISFADNQCSCPKETLLKGVSLWTRWKIWREFCAERKYRARDFLNTKPNQPSI